MFQYVIQNVITIIWSRRKSQKCEKTEMRYFMEGL